jgi:lipopolysaccharide transport system permease protein
VQRARVIRPTDRLNEGAIAATRHILRELVQYRDHISTAFRQDFRGLYQGTVFGVGWNVLIPLVPITIYVFLALFRVLPNFEGVSSASYVALGATIWFLLIGCIQQPLQVVRARNAEVMKTALPLSAMVVSGFAQLLFETIVRMAFVVAVILFSGTKVHWSAVLLPVAVLPAILLFVGLGLILAMSNVIYADVGRVTIIVLQYGIFVSGVIFPVASLPFSGILEWNPAYIFIEEARVLLFRGLPETGWLLSGYAMLGCVVFLLGCRVFYFMEYRVRGIG